MYISMCVIAYNEENSLNSILKDIIAQDYDHSQMEVVLVNSASTDRTRELMERFARANQRSLGQESQMAAENPESVDEATDYEIMDYEISCMKFKDVQVLDNPKKTLPCGWNVALDAYKGDAILKVDAHASIPLDFVSKNVNVLETGEDICGGQRPTMIDESTPWKDTLLLAENSMFGSSIAPYRNNPGRSYVNSMFHAAYRREVFDTIGGFNEDLARTEDNEVHYRMREAGFKLCFDPEIISYQHIRSSLSKMMKQKYANGYWIGLTSGVCPKCLSLYHFVPFAFVVAIILSALACGVMAMLGATLGFDVQAAWGSAWSTGIDMTAENGEGIYYLIYCIILGLTGLMWGIYWLLAIAMAMIAVIGAKEKRNWTCLALPFLFFLLHISYGIGTVIGLIKMPSWRKNLI